MSIRYEPESGIITMLTDKTSYQMQIGPLGYLLHTYYGRRCCDSLAYLHLERDCGFSPNPYELADSRSFSMDTMPQEYSSANTGDFRIPSLLAEAENGITGTDLRYISHRILREKYSLRGLPAAFAGDDEEDAAETLSVTLADAATGLKVELLYGVYEQQNVITRAVRFVNSGEGTVYLSKAASACLDLPFGEWDRIHFHGRHAMERMPERAPIQYGMQTVSSCRGASGHQHNPFIILCEHGATEDQGECYGLMLCYSGNHQMEVEMDQTGSVRVIAGIAEAGFRWKLEPGEEFETPELLMTFTDRGLDVLSNTYHRFIRRCLCRSAWTWKKRPVLINSWEAAYLDFDENSILKLANDAKKLGIEMLVLDDGWFGKRDNDRCALGDWTPNSRKLPHGLSGLVRQINSAGMKFGLWIEPEMVSENSELYRRHPDWVLAVPGRKPAIGRSQMVLDLSREEIVQWIYDTIAGLLRENNIEYIKWDMNRSLTDVYSPALPADRQGETAHRYVLGLYSIMDRLTAEFPQVLFEGCSGGGGRFDAGMLAYFPQIWCSDNTDPVARLLIQQGTSYGYPVSSVGAHVSASPNHQTGRTAPFGTRAAVAMAGTFGYELDPGKLSEEEQAEIVEQIRRFHETEDLVREGEYHRLTEPENSRFTAWQFISADRVRSLLTLVLKEPEGNPKPLHVRLKGLESDRSYRIMWAEFSGCRFCEKLTMPDTLSGAALMYGGLTMPRIYGDYPSVQMLLQAD